MSVKAKFRCDHVIDCDYGGNHKTRTVSFSAVYGNTGDNASYSKATPSGSITMIIDKETLAYDYFKPGSEYYLTFETAVPA